MLKSKTKRLNNVEDHYIFRDPLRLTESKSRKLDHLQQKLVLLHPGNKLKQSKKDLINISGKLQNNYNQLLKGKQSRYLLDLNKLELLNPLNIMKKGYSVTKVNGHVIKSIQDVKKEDFVDILVSDGIISAKVDTVRKDENNER